MRKGGSLQREVTKLTLLGGKTGGGFIVPVSGVHFSCDSAGLTALLAVKKTLLPQQRKTGIGNKLTQLLCGFHTHTGIHAFRVSCHQKIQMGLHNNHTSVFLDKNKTELSSLDFNNRTSSYPPATLFTVSWLIFTFVFGWSYFFH